MNIVWNKASQQFHLYNDRISYIIGVALSGELTNLYFGKKIRGNGRLIQQQIDVCGYPLQRRHAAGL